MPPKSGMEDTATRQSLDKVVWQKHRIGKQKDGQYGWRLPVLFVQNKIDGLSVPSHGEAPKADLSYLPETMPVIIGTRKAVRSWPKKRSKS